MRKDPKTINVLEVFLKNRPEYLSRVRRITACLAESAGVDASQSERVAASVSNACKSAFGRSLQDAACVEIAVSAMSLLARVRSSKIGACARRRRFRSRLRLRIAI